MTTVVIKNGMIYTDSKESNIGEHSNDIDIDVIRKEFVKLISKDKHSKEVFDSMSTCYHYDRVTMQPTLRGHGKFIKIADKPLKYRGKNITVVAFCNNLMGLLTFELFHRMCEESGNFELDERFNELCLRHYVYGKRSIKTFLDLMMPGVTEEFVELNYSLLLQTHYAFVADDGTVFVHHPKKVENCMCGYQIHQFKSSDTVVLGSGAAALIDSITPNMLANEWVNTFVHNGIELLNKPTGPIDFIREASTVDPYTNDDIRVTCSANI